jgi:hypothetical protein
MRINVPLSYLRLNFKISILCLLFVILSCGSKDKKEPRYTIITLQKAFQKDRSGWDSLELLVPQIGCNSCINLLIEKYMGHQLNTKLSMIGVTSQRELRLNYGEEFLSYSFVAIYPEMIHRPITQDCFGQPAFLFYKEDTIYYFCFKTDEVNDIISYLAGYE